MILDFDPYRAFIYKNHCMIENFSECYKHDGSASFSRRLLHALKEQIMIQGQSGSSGHQQSFLTSQRSHLLRTYPVMLPLILLSGSIGLFVLSTVADAF